MKKTLFTLIILVTLVFSAVGQQSASKKSNPAGTWKFEALSAPEGYTNGTIVVGFEEKKPTTSMAFTGTEYKFPGENVKASNDSVLFSIYLQGQDIRVLLKMETESKMSGKAVYSEGEVPLTLTKVAATEGEAK
jgi:hypothetical protein